MPIMITGGTGFLGSYLARHLIQEKGETDMVLFDMYPTVSRVSDIQYGITIVHGDVLEPHELLATMARYYVDWVVHLAYILGGPAREKAVPYLRVQCMGTANVFEAGRIHGVSRVVYASSVAVYGAIPNRDQVTEDVVSRPNSFYGACKLWAEHISETYNHEYGLDVISLRIFSFALGVNWGYP